MDGNRMTSVEIQAVSVEAAVGLALEQLGLGQDDVDIEILSDAGPDEDEEALVRVTAKGMASQPTPRDPRAIGGRRQPGPRRVPGDRPSSRGAPPRDRRPGPDLGDGYGNGPGTAPGIERAERPDRGERPDRMERPARLSQPRPDRVDTEEETVAKEIAGTLLGHMGIRAEVIATDNPSLVPPDEEEPPTAFIDILGRDLGHLIGRRGDNLGQLQYLVNLLVNHRLGTFSRVILDVEGYRSRREEALIGLAERVARQVARGGQPITLEPMPPNERRIIHLMLRPNPAVTTESHGEGSMRRITVLPRG